MAEAPLCVGFFFLAVLTAKVWASAHTTQFVQPGWHMLAPSSTGSGLLPQGGTYVTYVGPETAGQNDFTLVLETATRPGCAHCGFASQTIPVQQLDVVLAGGLASHVRLSLWVSNASVQFVQLADIAVASAAFTLILQPDSIYTVSSTSGQTHGQAAAIAPPGPFPLPYNDSFDSTGVQQEGRYWADQCGSWQVVPAKSGSGRVLRQCVTERPGVNQWAGDSPAPLTVLGDVGWQAYSVAVDVLLNPDPAASVALCGRVSYVGIGQYPVGICVNVSSTGEWLLLAADRSVLGSGRAVLDPAAWHRLGLVLSATNVSALLDGELLALIAPLRVGAGMVALSSSWHVTDFDNFEVAALPTPHAPAGSGVTEVLSLGPGRTDYNGLCGMQLQLTVDVEVKALGRYVCAGNSRVHTVSVYDSDSGQLLGNTSVDTRSPADELGFAYGSVAGGLKLRAGQRVYLVTEETSDGDVFYDVSGTALMVNTSLATSLAGCYRCTPPETGCSGGWQTNSGPGSSYGPVNFIVAV